MHEVVGQNHSLSSWWENTVKLEYCHKDFYGILRFFQELSRFDGGFAPA